MKKVSGYSLLAMALPGVMAAADLKKSRFTQVVNDVKVVTLSTKNQKAAAINEVFNIPDVIRTGPSSRAELVAEDRTITRIGANSIFSFDAANRTMNLEQGSILFHSPKGKGGGNIRTGAATASVLGTTLMISATKNGGMKVSVLEGKARIRLPNGATQTLRAGQLAFVLPGSQRFSPVVTYHVDSQVKESNLVGGFEGPLPSLGKINQTISQQVRQIDAGDLEETGQLVVDVADGGEVVVTNQRERNSAANPKRKELSRDEDPDDEKPRHDMTPLERALSTDVRITSGDLRSAGDNLILQPEDGLGGEFVGVFARNLTFGNPLPDSGNPPRDAFSTPSLTINLQQFNRAEHFYFLAQNDIHFNHNVVFDYGTRRTGVTLSAGDSITMAPGTDVRYRGRGPFLLNSGGPLDFTQVGILNEGGGLHLNSSEGARIQNSYLFGAILTTLAAAGDIVIGQSTMRAGAGFTGEAVHSGPDNYSTIQLISHEGSILANGNTFECRSLNLSAENRVSVRNSSIHASAVNMSGRTIVLENLSFSSSSQLNFRTARGGIASENLNSQGLVENGRLNLLGTVTIGDSPARSLLRIGPNNTVYYNPYTEASAAPSRTATASFTDAAKIKSFSSAQRNAGSTVRR